MKSLQHSPRQNEKASSDGFFTPNEQIDFTGLVGKTLIAIVNLPPRTMMGISSEGMLLSAECEQNGQENVHLLMVDNHIPAGARLH
jgi:tRNA-binding EMAP/Myf-like protein